RGEGREAALHFRVDDGDGALETALGCFDDIGVGNLLRGGLELAEARGYDLGDVALLVTLRDGDRLIELAILESARGLLHEHARLLARCAVHERAVNHDADGINREKKKNDDDGERETSHVVKHVPEVPAHVSLVHCGKKSD